MTLSKPLAPSASTTISVILKMTHAMKPFPTEITQLESQSVVYSGNVFFYSPYKSTSQTTVVKLASSQVESYTQSPAKVEKKDSTITYGPYQDVDARSDAPLEVHFENNKPFLTVTKLVRELEISHWGNLAVEEWFWVEHSGAKLQGPWSRGDLQRVQRDLPYIKTLKMKLPAHAEDTYYRDDIGNISSSHVRPAAASTELELTPRFPLFGGWKTNFYIGYNLPLNEFLQVGSGGKFLLTAPFAVDVADAVIDEYELRVILPEGATYVIYHIRIIIYSILLSFSRLLACMRVCLC